MVPPTLLEVELHVFMDHDVRFFVGPLRLTGILFWANSPKKKRTKNVHNTIFLIRIMKHNVGRPEQRMSFQICMQRLDTPNYKDLTVTEHLLRIVPKTTGHSFHIDTNID